jgi:hypothetical protein
MFDALQQKGRPAATPARTLDVLEYYLTDTLVAKQAVMNLADPATQRGSIEIDNEWLSARPRALNRG